MTFVLYWFDQGTNIYEVSSDAWFNNALRGWSIAFTVIQIPIFLAAAYFADVDEDAQCALASDVLGAGDLVLYF